MQDIEGARNWASIHVAQLPVSSTGQFFSWKLEEVNGGSLTILKNHGKRQQKTHFLKQWRSWILRIMEQKLRHNLGKDAVMDYQMVVCELLERRQSSLEIGVNSLWSSHVRLIVFPLLTRNFELDRAIKCFRNIIC